MFVSDDVPAVCVCAQTCIYVCVTRSLTIPIMLNSMCLCGGLEPAAGNQQEDRAILQ